MNKPINHKERKGHKGRSRDFCVQVYQRDRSGCLPASQHSAKCELNDGALLRRRYGVFSG
jgi:hypothetical protein